MGHPGGMGIIGHPSLAYLTTSLVLYLPCLRHLPPNLSPPPLYLRTCLSTVELSTTITYFTYLHLHLRHLSPYLPVYLMPLVDLHFTYLPNIYIIYITPPNLPTSLVDLLAGLVTTLHLLSVCVKGVVLILYQTFFIVSIVW